MNRILSFSTFFLVTLYLVLSPASAYAHGAGTAPYLRINQVFAIPNPLNLVRNTASSFIIPQDLAPDNYLLNQPLTFEIDDSQLMTFLPSDLLKTTKFMWDFGDGTKSYNKDTTHTYSQIGSYVVRLKLQIYEKNNPTPTEYIDSYLFNILPIDEALLPQAVIKVNGSFIKDPLSDELTINFSDKITFDASSSKKTTGEIIEYLWDFGDGTMSDKALVTHNYSNEYLQTPVLRIKDKNGFLSYSFARLTNNQMLHKSTLIVSQKQELEQPKIAFAIGIVLILLTIMSIFFVLRKRK